ncbi:MAG TPA: M28 family peptidase [Thermoguttaceae bacterium]|nr:M28 family peptidase [Thermoguttaceae bacterium]
MTANPIHALRNDVERLALPSGRMVGSHGHAVARAYLLKRLTQIGLRPYIGDSFCLQYGGEGGTRVNLVGVVRGRDARKPPLLVGAHYDSVIPAPCADDNCAALAVALSAAGVLQRRRPPRDVVIALFDAEEPPHFLGPGMGSIRFYEGQMRPEGVHAAVIMDLVGHDVVVPFAQLRGNRLADALASRFPRLARWDVALPIVRDLFFITGAESHPGLAPALENVKLPRRLRLIAALNDYVGDMSDHGVFRRHGVPYLFLSCGRWPHYHAPTDTPDRLNYRKMQRIAKYLVRLVESLCDTQLEERRESADTVDFEIRCLKRALGPILPLALRTLGIKRLETRQDLTDLAGALLAAGL